jgi:hypothetical protein
MVRPLEDQVVVDDGVAGRDEREREHRRAHLFPRPRPWLARPAETSITEHMLLQTNRPPAT